MPSLSPTSTSSGIAAIMHPFAEHLPTKLAMLYSTIPPNRGIAVETRSLSNTGSRARGSVTVGLGNSSVAPGSSLVSAMAQDAVYVYGVLNDGQGTIAMFSPSFEFLNAKAPTGLIAGSADQETIWLYYETINEDGTSSIAMVDSFLSNTEGSNNSGAQNVNAGTWISAVTDSSQVNWVVFQRKGGQVAILNQSKGKQTDVNADAKYFGEKTPLAITFVPRKYFRTHGNWMSEEARGKLFVYWVGASGVLLRAVSEVSDDSDLPVFGEPEEVGSGSHFIELNAQMAVVCDKDAGKNYIYTIMKGTKEVKGIENSWAKE